MKALALEEGLPSSAAAKLNNVLMQMRKNCNHPDLITSTFTQDLNYPTPEELIKQCGKMELLDRLLKRLHAGGHKVLIFSQVRREWGGRRPLVGLVSWVVCGWADLLAGLIEMDG